MHSEASDYLKAPRRRYRRFAREPLFARRPLPARAVADEPEAVRRCAGDAAGAAERSSRRRRCRMRSASRSCAAATPANRAARPITSARHPSSIRAMATCSSISATPIGSTRIRRRRSTGCAKPCAAIRATGTRISSSAWHCNRPARRQKRRASASWRRGCRRSMRDWVARAAGWGPGAARARAPA